MWKSIRSSFAAMVGAGALMAISVANAQNANTQGAAGQNAAGQNSSGRSDNAAGQSTATRNSAGQNAGAQDDNGQPGAANRRGAAGQRTGRAGAGGQDAGTGQVGQTGIAGGQGAAGNRGPINDRVLANWLTIDNSGEIQVSELGQQRAGNAEVKEFAQKMAEDHRNFIGKLRQFAGGPGATLPDTGAADRPDANQRTRRQGSQGNQDSPGRNQDGTSGADQNDQGDEQDESGDDDASGQAAAQGGAQRTDRSAAEPSPQGTVNPRANRSPQTPGTPGATGTTGQAGLPAAGVTGQATAAGQAGTRSPEPGEGAQQRPGAGGREGTIDRDATAIRGGGRGMGGMGLIALKRELAEECLQSTRRELESKDDAEFDKCFMFQQVAMHMEAADTLKVFSRHASPELKAVLAEGLKTTNEHLEHAKQISQTLDKSEGDAPRERTSERKTKGQESKD